MGNEMNCNLTNFANDIEIDEDESLVQHIQTNEKFDYKNKRYSKLLKLFFTKQTLLYPKNDINLSQFKTNIKKLKKKILSIKKDTEPEKYYSLSCILGAFLGDSLGSYCEFNNKNDENYKKIFKGDNKFKKPPGQITDDSEMAFSFAFAILDTLNLKEIDSNIIYYYYGCWFKSKPFDCGNTISNALKFFNFQKNIGDDILKDIKFPEINETSLSNGFLMRINTFVVWFYYCYYNYLNNIIKSDDKNKFLELFNLIKKEGLKDNICTHLNKEVNSATGFFVFLALIAMLDYSADIILNKFDILLSNEFTDSYDKLVFKNINSALNDLNKSDFNKDLFFYPYGKYYGYYFYSFKLTLYYLKFFDNYNEDSDNDYSKFRVIMNEICNLGGDTDTNCAIVGTVIGPIIGLDNFGYDLKILLKFIPNDRIQYTNSLIYYYVEFLDKNKEQLNNNEKNKYNNNNDNDSDDSEIINPLIDNDNDNDNIEDEKKQHKKKNVNYCTLNMLLSIIHTNIDI
jgi:ADP-ribosylglycohydrolase